MNSAAIARRPRRLAPPVAWSAGVFLALVPAVGMAIFVVNAPWVRPASVGGITEACMTLTSTEGATLVGAHSDIAGSAAIVTGGRNRRVERLPLPAGKAVLLEPGASRVRLLRLTRALKLGDRVPLTLTIEGADGSRREIQVSAEVRRRSAIDDHRLGHAH